MHPTNPRLPRRGKLDIDDVAKLFLKVANLCEPEHPNLGRYPLAMKQLDYESFDRNFAASCGPTAVGASLRVNMKWARGHGIIDPYMEPLLMIMLHETVHIEIGTQPNQPRHPPTFWDTMAGYAWDLIYNWNTVQRWFKADDLVQDIFIKQVVKNPTENMVDGRCETLQQRQDKLAQAFDYNSASDLL
jgi:hypothetical protein